MIFFCLASTFFYEFCFYCIFLSTCHPICHFHSKACLKKAFSNTLHWNVPLSSQIIFFSSQACCSPFFLCLFRLFSSFYRSDPGMPRYSCGLLFQTYRPVPSSCNRLYVSKHPVSRWYELLICFALPQSCHSNGSENEKRSFLIITFIVEYSGMHRYSASRAGRRSDTVVS